MRPDHLRDDPALSGSTVVADLNGCVKAKRMGKVGRDGQRLPTMPRILPTMARPVRARMACQCGMSLISTWGC